MWDPLISSKLDKMDIKLDEDYQADIDSNEELTRLYGVYIDTAPHDKHEREYFTIKYSSVERGYGLFAKKYIMAGEIIGLYTGIVSERGIHQSTNYMW
jgi:hypothetical protein